MQEKPLTPYQKTQLAAAAFLALVVTVAAGLAFALRPRATPAAEPVLAAADAPLRDAVAAPVFLHATALRPSKDWLVSPKPSAEDLRREALLAAASGVKPSRVEALRREGRSWAAIARTLGWPARSAKLFAASGVLVGRPAAGRHRA